MKQLDSRQGFRILGARYEDYLGPYQPIDGKSGINAILFASQPDVHQDDGRSMLLSESDGGVGSRCRSADIYPNDRHVHAPKLSYDWFVIHDEHTSLEDVHDCIGMGVRISVVVPLPFLIVIVPLS